MFLFELFGLGEMMTYLLIALLAAVVIAAICLVCVLSKKNRVKKEPNKTVIAANSTKTSKDESSVETQEKEEIVEEIEEKVDAEEKLETITEEDSTLAYCEEIKEEEADSIEEVIEEPIKEEEVSVEEVKEELKEEIDAIEEKNPDMKAKKETRRHKGKYAILKEGQFFRYRLKASNGEPLIVSEPYSSEKACRNGIETLKRNIENITVDIKEDKHGLFHFVFITKQGRVLAQSANYKSIKSAQNASNSSKRFALTDDVEVEEGTTSHIESEIYDVEIKTETTGRYEILKENGEYEYVLKASNGRVICHSQMYRSEATCRQAVENFRNVVYDGNFYIFHDKNDKYQFKLYNKQKRLVMSGQVYDSQKLCKSAIESIKRFAKHAKLD